MKELFEKLRILLDRELSDKVKIKSLALGDTVFIINIEHSNYKSIILFYDPGPEIYLLKFYLNGCSTSSSIECKEEKEVLNYVKNTISIGN